MRSWPIEYSDERIVAFSLPVPGGCISMMRRGQSGNIEDGHVLDLKVLTDFIYVSYYGSLNSRSYYRSADSCSYNCSADPCSDQILQQTGHSHTCSNYQACSSNRGKKKPTKT